MAEQDDGQNHISQTGQYSWKFVTSAEQEYPSNSSEITSNPKKNKQKWSDLELQDRANILLTFGILLITGCTCWVFIQQSMVMQGQLVEMKNSGVEQDMGIIVAKGQMVSLSKEVTISEEDLEASHRPYLGIDTVSDSIDPIRNTVEATAVIKNFGSNPASDVTITPIWYMGGKPLQRQSGADPMKNGIIFPGSVREWSATIHGVDMARLGSGKLDWRVRVFATYRWTNKKYQYCEEWSWDIYGQNFSSIGACQANP